MAFSYNYKPLDYKTAQGQVSKQVDPLFNRAIQGVNQQKYQSDVQAGQVAAARGLGHSGLAADQLNKIAIAAQGQVGDLNAQRATQIATLANEEMWRDKNYSLQDRSQKRSEYDSDRNYNYQAGRDKIADSRYKTEWNYNVGRDKLDDQWRQKEWSQMSPAEKARMALQYSYSKKLGSGGGGGGGGRGRSGGRSGGSSSRTTNSRTSNNQSNRTTTNSALDNYAKNVQRVEELKKRNAVYGTVFRDPVSIKDNPNLSAWDKMKLIGL